MVRVFLHTLPTSSCISTLLIESIPNNAHIEANNVSHGVTNRRNFGLLSKNIQDVNSAKTTMGTTISLLWRFIKKLIHILNARKSKMNGFIIHPLMSSCATNNSHTLQITRSAMCVILENRELSIVPIFTSVLCDFVAVHINAPIIFHLFVLLKRISYFIIYHLTKKRAMNFYRTFPRSISKSLESDPIMSFFYSSIGLLHIFFPAILHRLECGFATLKQCYCIPSNGIAGICTRSSD